MMDNRTRGNNNSWDIVFDGKARNLFAEETMSFIIRRQVKNMKFYLQARRKREPHVEVLRDPFRPILLSSTAVRKPFIVYTIIIDSSTYR